MRVLLTNDDGIRAPGLEALANEFGGVGEIVRAAPLTEQSGVSHGISLSQGLFVEDLTELFGYEAYAVSGTPADCVKLALTELVKTPVDFVISGVNWGTNVGIDIHYSGTVAAAMEGAMFGIPSIAVSLKRHGNANFAYAARVARAVFEVLREAGPPADHVMNINIPACDAAAVRGVRLIRHSTRAYNEEFIKKADHEGNHAFWLTGEVALDEANRDTDLSALTDGYITVTPIQLDITGYRELDRLRSARFEELAEGALFPEKKS